jgi:peptide/nickel transport system substrate-binding protein
MKLLKNGEVDIALSLSAEDFLALQNSPNLNMTAVPSHDPMMLQMNCQKEPFKSVKVRQAVSYAVPYQELMDSIWKVAARPYKSPFIDVCLGYTQEFFTYRTDLDKAKSLMAEAGVKGTINADMYVCGEILPEIMPTAKVIQTALSKIGINITIKDVNEQEFRTVSFAHSFDLMLDPHTHQVADGYYVSYDDYGDERWGIENMNQYFEPEVFKLQEESLKARSEAERIEYIREMQRVILEGSPQAYLFQINSLTGAQTSVRGMEWDLNGRMFYQHVYKA